MDGIIGIVPNIVGVDMIPFPNKKYNIIVVDPPYPIKKILRKTRDNQTKELDYPTMSMQEIKKLEIKTLADDDCWIFLWTTQKYLFESKDLLEHWGFNYLCLMAWKKTYGISAGMPLFGFQWNAEFILVGYNKKPDIYPKRKLIPLIFEAENIKHSKKPDKFYNLIENLGKEKIDIFARNTRHGWDVWGNEV